VNKTIPVFLLFFSFAGVVFAQQARLVDSYSQSWSGGIAGHRGENFLFVIEFTRIKGDVNPDTLWIGEQPIPVLITDSLFSDSQNTKKIKKKNSIRFEIHAGTSFDEYEYRNMPPGDETKKEAVKPPPYKGIGLLSYTYMGKKKYYEIGKIMRRGEPLNYP